MSMGLGRTGSLNLAMEIPSGNLLHSYGIDGPFIVAIYTIAFCMFTRPGILNRCSNHRILNLLQKSGAGRFYLTWSRSLRWSTVGSAVSWMGPLAEENSLAKNPDEEGPSS